MSPRSSQIKQPVKPLKRVPSAKREAEDEVLRPIPLDEDANDAGFGKSVDYFIALADKALKNKPTSH